MGYRYPSLFSHLTDLHSIFKLYAENSKEKYSLKTSASNFFQQFQSELFYSCRDQQIFSHCQPHYIFSFNSDSTQFSSYITTPCIELMITLITSVY